MSPEFTGIMKAVIWDLNNSSLIIPSVYYLRNGWCKKLQSKMSFNQALSLYYSIFFLYTWCSTTHSGSHIIISHSELLPFIQKVFQKWSNAEAYTWDARTKKEKTIIMNTIYVPNQVDGEIIARKLILPAQILLEWKKVSPGAVSLNNDNIH